MEHRSTLAQRILDLDIRLQRQIYAGWPESWAELKWPVGSIRALLLIESGYARTPGEVADVLKISRTTVTGVLDRLEADSLITRTLDPQDRRSFVLSMTDAGRDLVRQIDGLRRDQLAEAMSRMDTATVRALYKGLEGLTTAMDSLRESPKPQKEEGIVR